MIGREVNNLNSLVGVTAPVVTTLPAEARLNSFILRCILIDNAVNTQRLEQVHARIIAVNGHVGCGLNGLAFKVGLIGCLQIAGTKTLGVEETGEHIGIHILQVGLVVLEVEHILGIYDQRQVAIEAFLLDLLERLDVFLHQVLVAR